MGARKSPRSRQAGGAPAYPWEPGTAPSLPEDIEAACAAIWQRIAAGDRRLTTVDQLALRVIVMHRRLGILYDEGITLLGNPRGLSRTTVSRRYTKWESAGHLTVLRPAPRAADACQALLAGRDHRSWPWYCRELRRETGLLLDPELLRLCAGGHRPMPPALTRHLGFDPAPSAVLASRIAAITAAVDRDLSEDSPVLRVAAAAGSGSAVLFQAVQGWGQQRFTRVHTWRPTVGLDDPAALGEWLAQALAPGEGAVLSGAMLADNPELRQELLCRQPVLLLVYRGAMPLAVAALEEWLHGTPSRAIVILAGNGTPDKPGQAWPPLDPRESLAYLAELVGYAGRKLADRGQWQRLVWAHTVGLLREVQALASQLRQEVRRAMAASNGATADASELLAQHLPAALRRTEPAMSSGPSPAAARAFLALGPQQQQLLFTVTSFPAREWTFAELHAAAGGHPLGLDSLLEAAWLLRTDSLTEATYVCPAPARRRLPAAPLSSALAGMQSLWEGCWAPRLRARRDLAAALAAYAGIGDNAVSACLDAAEQARKDAALLPAAAALLLLIWRFLSDLLQPSGRTLLHLRLVRLADAVLRAVPATALKSDTAEWASAPAEAALIAAERSFMAWVRGELAEATTALTRAEGLLPPPATACTATGGQRQCLFTVHASVIAFRMLLHRDTMPDHPQALLTELRALLVRQHELQQLEDADDARRGWQAEARRNYPGWWEPGRGVARYHYWRSICWQAMAAATAQVRPEDVDDFRRQARAEAAFARAGYAERAPRHRLDRSRLVLTILLRAIIEHTANDLPAALHLLEEASAAAARYHRPDHIASCRLQEASWWQESGLPNAEARTRQALQRAWQAARGCDPSVAATILVKGRRLLGPTWDPAAPTRHRHRATSAQK